MPPLLLLLLLLVAVYALTVGSRGRRKARRRRAAVEDPNELAEAEDEVKELDAFTEPDDAEEKLPDWGPGAGPR